MPLVGSVAPPKFSPGVGRAAPGPVAYRHPVASVGDYSSVPYGSSDSIYVNPGLVKGFIGPAAGSLRRPTTWYIRTGGSNTNGGSSAGTAADRTGTDGSTTSGSRTFTAASGAFTQADVGKGICIQTATKIYAKIESVTNSTTVVLTNPAAATTGSLTWAIGGSWASPVPFLNCNVSTAQSTCGVQAGDTVYIGPGVYRATYVIGANFGAAWAATGGTRVRDHANFNGRISIIGDVTGANTGDPAGPVTLTAYTTNDKTAPSITTLLDYASSTSPAMGGNNLSFYNICFQLGANGLSAATLQQNLWVESCSFQTYFNTPTSRNCINLNNSSGLIAYAPLGLWVDKCRFYCGNSFAVVNLTYSIYGTENYDVGIQIHNSYVHNMATSVVSSGSTGSGTGKPGGPIITGTTYLGSSSVITTTAAWSTTIPVRVYGCVIMGAAGASLNANASGQIIEDWNLFFGPTPRTNVTAGTHSVSDGSYALMMSFGQELIWGGTQRPYSEPLPSSSWLGFGDGGNNSARYDVRGLPRPSGGAALPYPSPGAYERGNVWGKETGTVRTGASALSITGPGFQDFQVAVDAALTTITGYMRYDSSYAGVKPRFLILNGEEAGVADATSAAVVSVDTWEQLSVAFTPTSKGIVTVRLVSSDQSGAGKAFADDFSVA